jgi:hypothetical protein
MTKAEKLEQIEAIEHLQTLLKPGDTVWAKVESVSRSGMSREISLFIPKDWNGDGKLSIEDITWWASRAMNDKQGKTGGIRIGGCGMDMCFALVYNLGRVLFSDGFKVEGRGRNGDTSGWDRDGGYALNKRDL